MGVDFDFSDVEQFFQQGKDEVQTVETEVGKEAVQYAIDNGSYQGRTKVLRQSNEFNVTDEGLELKNTAKYASYVESKGFEVLSGAALEAERLLKEQIA